MLKRKILAIVLAVFMAFSLVGCNTQGIAYLKELKKMSKWEGIEAKGEISINVSLLGENATIAMDYTAYTQQKDNQMEMTFNIKDIKLPEGTEGMFLAPLKFSPIKMYMDGMKMYISTSYIKELCALTGEDPKTLGVDISKKYIALDMTSMMKKMDRDTTDIASMTDEGFKMLEGLKVEVPMTQKGRTYTVTFNDEQMVKLFVDYMVAVMDFTAKEGTFESMGISKEQLKEMGMTEDALKAQIEQIKQTYKQMGEEMKDIMKGSSATLTSKFTNKNFDKKGIVKIQLDMEGLPVVITIDVNQSGKKVSKKVISFPTDVEVYDLETLMVGEMQQPVISKE